MRLKIVIIVLLLALGLLGIIAFVSKESRSTTVESNSSPPGIAATPAESSPSPSKIEPVVSAVIPASVPVVSSDTNHAQYVHQRIAELDALAMNNDAASLEAILSELHNPDRQIRKGALEATIQFDDRAAIPRLKEIAAQTEDEEEKDEILKAADFINLPSLTEYIAQQRAQREALGITNSPTRSRTNRLRNNLRQRPQPFSPTQPQMTPQ